MINTLRLYYHTLKHLKPVQIFGRLWFRLYRPRPDNRPAPGLREVVKELVEPCRRVCSMTGPMEFCFLKENGRLENAEDWNSPGRTKLWLYNLHYFDDLNAQNSDKRHQWHLEYIPRWIAENPPGEGVGWEPYPTSLRMVNWIKWVLQGNSPAGGMADSLAVQARWLEKRLEYHLLGNHLLANAKALVAVGLFFHGEEAEKWYETGMKLLKQELFEQVLPDGGHFERSPMYHLIVLEDLLDLINLHYVYGRAFPAVWTDIALRMLDWSRIVRHPDEEIPFFNDATFGIAPHPKDVDKYAERLGIQIPAKPGPGVWHLPHSGYVRLEKGKVVLIADMGPVGPDYLPGHAHADTLSFELSLGDRRVIVNSGTSEYGEGPERLKQRSTAAHSTVVVDGENSSEVWGNFRMARRARIIKADSWKENNACLAEASHDGYHRLPGRPLHSRTWEINPKQLNISDEFSGRGKHEMDIIFHLASGLKPTFNKSGVSITDTVSEDNMIRIIYDSDQIEAKIERSCYHPGFGVNISTWQIVFHISCELPFNNKTVLKWSD